MSKKQDVWKTNYAKNERIREAVRKVFIPKISSVREQRQTLEDEWMSFYNMWNVTKDGGHTYRGRANLYIPEVRKNIEAQARQIVDLAFPNEDFFSCYPGAAGTIRGAEAQKNLRTWQIQQANLVNKFHIFARQECMYGTSPAYVGWSKKIEHAFQSARNPKTGKIQVTRKLVELFNGPDFLVRDLFKWYALNPKKFDFQDDGCFENVVVNRFDIEQEDKAGLVWNADDIFKGNSEAHLQSQLERDIERAETLGLTIDRHQGYSGSASLKRDDDEKLGTYLKTVIYTKVVCPEACLEDEDPNLGIPMKIVIYDNEHIGLVGRNPFWHQRAPYLVGRYIYPNADEFYGQGIPKATQYQQHEINSKAEQAMDSVTLALNPIAIIDPALASQNGEFEIEPGATWFANPNAVKFSAMPDVSATGYAAIGQLRSQIQDFSDRAPSMPSQLSGKARSATQAEFVERALSIDFKCFQRQNEGDVLAPLMEMWESLTDQNADDEQIIMILGRDSGDWKRSLVTKEMLIGNYRYNWKVSSDFGNKSIKARQLIDAMKVAGSLPPEAQSKLRFNFAEAFRVLYKEILLLPNADRIVPDPMAQERQDPEIVYKMIKLGMETEILNSDDNAAFMRFFSTKLEEEKDKHVKTVLSQQILLHGKQLEMKRQLLQSMIQQQQQQAQIQQQMMLEGKGGASQAGGMQGSGNRTQLSPNGSVGDMGSGTRA